ncbi:DNA-binding transcriptional regulator, AcrR family [Parafrankia irregularis]|uniref:DNA-binding transcriptional regulator, AcrR family n=1 Tax=Parafrankia irregularis TaxID=795642 RepID=A0A0S4QS50_9ACTN|nr:MULTISPECIES: TetR/AcrR family transcriptional regulator [Parafrankia]MBE3199886.1 TetR/AcrR family transcriptional regulator [Parafrankia sp. CH37]CUU58041.1 DNA-binding transcriptional regulator, AcrR family [Parafrankia irregularis]
MQATSTAQTTPGRRRPRNRKAQIALAAAELFCERGYHGVGIDEIAAVVGISGPAVYRHFPNKYAILLHASRELIDTLVTAADEALAVPEEPAEQMARLLAATARVSVQRRRVGALYQWQARYLEPAHQGEVRAGLTALVRRISDLLLELRPDLPPPSAVLLSRAALSAIGSISTHRAAIADSRAEQILRSAAWTLLTTDLPAAVRHATAGGSEPAGGGSASMRPGSRREALLTEAVRLFDRLGYHAVSIDDIGRAAGINASGVYRYFPGKADLLAAVYYRAAERLSTSTTSALATASSPADALRRLIDAYVDLTFAHNDLVSVYLAENNNLPTPDRHELRRLQREHVEEWVRLLVTIRPELAASEARLLAHAALNLVMDLGRTTSFNRSDGSEQLVRFLALRMLVP